MADIENTNSQATSPTGDIKIFIDTFNSELDKEIKLIQDAKSNYKNTYESAIQISTPLKEGDWPNDPKVLTIGDLFKYTFPDIEGYTYISDARNKLKSLKDDVQKEMYFTILKGINSNNKLNTHLDIKKPGVTNPDLYSAGQYWFDVFMKKVLSSDGPIFGKGSVINTYSNKYGLTSSISLFTPTGNIEDKRFDYVDFEEYVLSDIEGYVNSITNIDINLLDNNGSFSGLKTQYKSGILTNISNDPNFNINRGKVNETTGEFIGNYEQILLYKAFVQAGDNYKPVVLPYNNPVDPTPPTVSQNTTSNVEQPTDVFKFNVEKQDTFVVVGGTSSTVMEFIIVPNDGTEYIFNNTQYDYGPLDDEYQEGGFEGEEELALQFVANEQMQSQLDPNIKGSDFTVDESNIDFNSPNFNGPNWKSFNIDSFVSSIKKTSYKPKSIFEESLKKVLYFIKQDAEIKDAREAAYMLATAFGESNYSLQRWEADYVCTGTGIPYGPDGPCSAATNYYRSTKGGKANYYTLGTDKNGQCYFGRGLIQLTGKSNYKTYGELIGVDLLSNGDLAMVPQNAYKVASAYMRSNTFKHVLNGNLTKARRSVNGGTKGIDEINGAYSAWINIFNNANVA